MNLYRITPADSLKRINDYLLTFVGEVEVKLNAGGAQIYYPDTKLTATLTVTKNKLKLDCADEDSVTVNLIKNTGVRIFSERLHCFLPADPNLLPVEQTNPIFSQYGLKPIFRYRNSLVFFCQDKVGKIHLINRHLLEFLSRHPQKHKDKNFSVVAAPNIGLFVALTDRGLIPLNYYQYSRIINLSGLALAKTNHKIACFRFDKTNQTFYQTGQELTKIPQAYLAIKVNPDINYIMAKNKLMPQLNVSVFLD